MTAFSSPAASATWQQNNLILSHGTTQILVTADHVQRLREQPDQASFETYFWNQAMQNRKARRVLEVWVRKDAELITKLHQEICS